MLKHAVLDINECEQGTDNCSLTLPAPATCINDIGGYRCSCDNYNSFRLALDYRSCEGNYVTPGVVYNVPNAAFPYRHG